MRIAVMGDIHGNASALRAVLDAANDKKVDAICVTGDFVGYYYWPSEVLDMLIPLRPYCVCGNHEDMLFRAMEDPVFLDECTRRYGSGLGVAVESINPAHRSFLQGLPRSLTLELGGRRFLVAHGTPEDTNEYLYPDAPEQKKKQVIPPLVDVVCLGHTHYRMVCDVGNQKIVNPGSVGQPRDRIPGAAWALVDTDDLRVDLLSEAYDYRSVAREAEKRDPALRYLSEVFYRT